MAQRTITISEYDPAWPELFARLQTLLADTLGDLALRIEHVGSTAVVGLAAKPILDIIVVIESRQELPQVIDSLATLGYIHQGDRGVSGREAFRAGPRETDPSWPQHHLYVCDQANDELQRHVAFRDYLRQHPTAVQTYAERKRELAEAHPHDIDAYVQGKAFFVEACLRAVAEAEQGRLPDAPAGSVHREITAYYGKGAEKGRLSNESGKLEMARMQELLRRLLPAAPAIVLDVGGGPATHAGWLARDGWQVHLIDPMENLLAEAREVSAAQRQTPISSITQGEARALDWPDASVDAVLLFGPLYHLTERRERIAALAEAARVVRPGGPVLAIGISKFASALDGMKRRFIDDPTFRTLMEQDLDDGQHRSSPDQGRYFTTAFFHHPDELAAELIDAGLQHEDTLSIQGPGWLLQDFDEQWADPDRRKVLLDIARRLEAEPTLLGASGHMLAVGRKTS